MGWSWVRRVEADDEPRTAIASGETLCVAVLALDYGKSAKGITWAWASEANDRLALGHALEIADPAASVVAWAVIEIPLASGMEAPSGGETVGLDPKDDSPVASATPTTDAQDPPK